MKIICDSCGAKYTVSDEKVQGKTVKVKCRKCSAVIVVSSTGDVSTTGGQASAPDAASAGGAVYTVAVSDGDQRNMTIEEIVNAYNEGYIDADTFVWAEGMDDWLALRDVDPIVDALHEAAGQAEAPAADPEEELGATVAMVDGVPPELAGAPAPGAGATVEQSPFESAMAAAGAGGGGGLSFGSSGGGEAQGLNQIPQGDKSGFSSGPGEENSAIFSLNMLTAKVGAEGEAPAAPANFADEEDSGLIDLKALAAGISSDSALATPLDVAGGGGVFPLGAPPPVTAPAPVTVDTDLGAKKSNKMMLAILASAVVVLGAVLVFILVKGDGPTPAATTATPTVVTVVKTVVAAPEPTAAPTASATASATATSKVAAVRGPRPTGKGAPKSTAGGSKPPAAAAPKAPARGKCGCDPNDLMCNMRCAQK